MNLKLILVCWFLHSVIINCYSQKNGYLKDPNFIITPSVPISLSHEIKVFNDSTADAAYFIAIAADVPNNKKPMKVTYQLEPGHLFLILQKITGTDTINKVFGFYPLNDATLLYKKKVNSVIKDNSKRQYDVELKKPVSKEQFKIAINTALGYAKRKYHINDFNCYDYALGIFNTSCNDSLPFIRIRYPLFFGKGGSPCTFYKYMQQQKDSGTALAPYIAFGNLIAPASTKILSANRK